jgi:hypothetical protein
MFDDNLIETKKFQMYADKADTEAKRIELCTKYLKSKDALPKPPMPPIPYYDPVIDDKKFYVGPDTYHTVKAETSVDMLDYERDPVGLDGYLKVQLCRELTDRMLRDGMVTFHPTTDMYSHRYRIVATIDVVKKRESK